MEQTLYWWEIKLQFVSSRSQRFTLNKNPKKKIISVCVTTENTITIYMHRKDYLLSFFNFLIWWKQILILVKWLCRAGQFEDATSQTHSEVLVFKASVHNLMLFMNFNKNIFNLHDLCVRHDGRPVCRWWNLKGE